MDTVDRRQFLGRSGLLMGAMALPFPFFKQGAQAHAQAAPAPISNDILRIFPTHINPKQQAIAFQFEGYEEQWNIKTVGFEVNGTYCCGPPEDDREYWPIRWHTQRNLHTKWEDGSYTVCKDALCKYDIDKHIVDVMHRNGAHVHLTWYYLGELKEKTRASGKSARFWFRNGV